MPATLQTQAVIMEQPGRLALDWLDLTPPGAEDVVVDMEWSGISTGTERLLWTGKMPNFPGMGYPLVPGYESVGRVVEAGALSGARAGTRVFVPGARCYGAVRGLFGGSASRVVIPGAKALPVDESMGEDAILLALAATAWHVTAGEVSRQPDMIVGHGVVGRLLARIAVAVGAKPPVVWESNPARRDGAKGYEVVDPAGDERRDYRCICDASGDGSLLDTLISRLAPGGEIVLAGFYENPLSFAFPPAFMREARLRIAAQWQENDLAAVAAMAQTGRLPLDGLATHRSQASCADAAYRTAFTDAACLKMIIDWRTGK